VKYIFIGKQNVILCPKLKENQRKAAISALSAWFYGRNSIRFNILKLYGYKIVMSNIFSVIKKKKKNSFYFFLYSL
jgi:hypothetical protein